jgi:hypothetical protein
MAAAGVPMRTLQDWMGHRGYKTTLIYADYAPAANEAELVNAAFGKRGHQKGIKLTATRHQAPRQNPDGIRRKGRGGPGERVVVQAVGGSSPRAHPRSPALTPPRSPVVPGDDRQSARSRIPFLCVRQAVKNVRGVELMLADGRVVEAELGPRRSKHSNGSRIHWPRLG